MFIKFDRDPKSISKPKKLLKVSKHPKVLPSLPLQKHLLSQNPTTQTPEPSKKTQHNTKKAIRKRGLLVRYSPHFSGFSTREKSLLSKALSSGLTILSFCAVVVVCAPLAPCAVCASAELLAAAACFPSCPTAAAP